MTPGRKNIPILEVNIICYVGVKLKFAKQQHFDMFGHYCYGIQGPTVLQGCTVLFIYNQNLHNLQNDAETTTTDYAKVQILY